MIASICAVFLHLSTKEPMRTVIAEWTDSNDFMGASGMLSYFDRARQQDKTMQLVIGDSICGQMFSGLHEYNSQISNLATNAALMITGQYLLAEEYLENHPDATDIFLIMHPLTMIRTFDTEWSYRYSLMTFVETDTLRQLDKNTIETMKSVYGSFFMRKNVVRLIEDSPVCRKLYLSYLNGNVQAYEQSSSFEISDQYVRKLYELCKKKGVALHLYASPVSEYYREQVFELRKEYEETWMSSQFPDYMEDILYYPSEWTEDKSHFSGEYAEREKLNEVMEKAYHDTALLQNIKLR